ncbi:MAG: magnesium/cobalt transporter CorA, partial [Cyanobacteria bacterium]|nr:magnesium/cobalt transporter CorA [Cyanobacteriota bacterium]
MMTLPNRDHGLLQHRRAETVGRPPGSVVIDPTSPKPVIHLTVFSPDELLETTVPDAAAIRSHLERNVVVWVNVEGLGDEAALRSLAALFHLHPLALEDVVNVHQRPKVDRFGEHLFITARMPRQDQECSTEQLGLFLGRNFVLTFVEDPGDCFDSVRRRLRTSDGMLRRRGADYLAYALLDSAVDAYFPMLELFGDRLEELEDEAILKPTPALVARIHGAKRDLRSLRRIFWPLREAMNELVREPTHLVSEETRVYFRDLYDHTVQIIDLVETYRELGADLVDLYLSSLSNRMNEIMRVLTIMSTVFMPLSFIVGIYGMNF